MTRATASTRGLLGTDLLQTHRQYNEAFSGMASLLAHDYVGTRLSIFIMESPRLAGLAPGPSVCPIVSFPDPRYTNASPPPPSPLSLNLSVLCNS